MLDKRVHFYFLTKKYFEDKEFKIPNISSLVSSAGYIEIKKKTEKKFIYTEGFNIDLLLLNEYCIIGGYKIHKYNINDFLRFDTHTSDPFLYLIDMDNRKTETYDNIVKGFVDNEYDGAFNIASTGNDDNVNIDNFLSIISNKYSENNFNLVIIVPYFDQIYYLTYNKNTNIYRIVYQIDIPYFVENENIKYPLFVSKEITYNLKITINNYNFYSQNTNSKIRQKTKKYKKLIKFILNKELKLKKIEKKVYD